MLHIHCLSLLIRACLFSHDTFVTLRHIFSLQGQLVFLSLGFPCLNVAGLCQYKPVCAHIYKCILAEALWFDEWKNIVSFPQAVWLFLLLENAFKHWETPPSPLQSPNSDLPAWLWCRLGQKWGRDRRENQGRKGWEGGKEKQSWLSKYSH